MAKKQRRKRRRRPATTILVTCGLGLLGAVALVAFLAFDGGGERKRSAAPLRQPTVVTTERAVTVETVDKDYMPRTLTIPLGATVTWDNTGELPHTITDDRGAFDSGAFPSGAVYSHTFNTKGVFYYYCTLHHGMQGTLTVK